MDSGMRQTIGKIDFVLPTILQQYVFECVIVFVYHQSLMETHFNVCELMHSVEQRTHSAHILNTSTLRI